MESQYQYHGGSPVAGAPYPPLVSFPFGTALLMMLIFILSGIFSCIYHLDKLHRTFYPRAAQGNLFLSHSKPKDSHMDLKQKQKLNLSVVVPGDNVPKFIALPCRCEPPRHGKIAVDVQTPPPRGSPYLSIN